MWRVWMMTKMRKKKEKTKERIAKMRKKESLCLTKKVRKGNSDKTIKRMTQMRKKNEKTRKRMDSDG